MLNSLISGEKEGMKEILDFALLNGKIVELVCGEDKRAMLFPLRVVHLEGLLSVVGEDTASKSIVCIRCDEITRASVDTDTEYLANYGIMEIDDFLTSMRVINDSETRLVLKIPHDRDVKLVAENHFFGSPYMVTNSEGDAIWGATIELCDDLYEWLLEIGENVEILGPLELKKDFLHYCEKKLRAA